MLDLVLHNEATVRLGIFLSVFGLLALWEWYSPRRILQQNTVKRWVNNITLVVVSSILVRLIVPMAIVGSAFLAQENNWGLFNQLELPFWLSVILSILLLDLIVFLQHLNFHEIPILWRIHRVHHSDMDCDVSTGVRFHPIEILISVFIKIAAIVVLGAPILAVILFEILLNTMSMFTHSNIKLNEKLERVLRWVFVTPYMHQIHHSVLENEANSNFAFHISLWDRIFGTYTAKPEGGYEGMRIGLTQFNEDKWQTLIGILSIPFSNTHSGYSINRRDTRNADELQRINEILKKELVEKEEREQALVVARDKAQESTKIKSEFLANMSHELRTPMHSVLSYSDLGLKKLKDSPIDSKKLGNYFERIITNGNRLMALLNDLLDLSKLESGKIDIEFAEHDLRRVVGESINSFEVMLKEKNQNIEIIDPGADWLIHIDRPKIIQVITNLLSNAIKFSPPDTQITIALKNSEMALGHRKNDDLCVPSITLSVSDQGSGIPDDELESVFDKFIQSSKTKSGSGGTGLGLAISREIIGAHDGRIIAKNNESGGAEFIVTLPRQHSEFVPVES